MYVMDLPQKPESGGAFDHWLIEVGNAKKYLEQQLNVTITDDDLHDAIEKGNTRRQMMADLYKSRLHQPPPIKGLEFVNLMSKLGYYVDFDDHIKMLGMFRDELRQKTDHGNVASEEEQPRILWTGLGNSLGCSKVLELVEECGGVVVCQEGCGGITRSEDIITVSDGEDPLAAIARHYLGVTCACMTPNRKRFEDLERLIESYSIDGVIDLSWQFCQPFEIESYRVRELVKEKMGLPFLHVVTDYSESDVEQLRVRVEAFMEQIAVRKKYVH
jgi:benzoyl-CoA reductase/2-hydroxyglutaryl-CoA dehydratase subunit BcrC/BadD/HgdB